LVSKKSKTGAVPAMASTPEGEPTLATGELERLAKRSTAIASPTSASTASTRSPMRLVSAVAACITRARDSSSTGNFSTASKAAASLAPGAGLPLASLAAAPGLALPLVWGLVVSIARNVLDCLIGSEGRTV
jgi:hypothetical protein